MTGIVAPKLSVCVRFSIQRPPKRKYGVSVGCFYSSWSLLGLASSVLLDAHAPDSPLNRRISIIVMNKRTESAISQENGALFSVQDPGERPVS